MSAHTADTSQQLHFQNIDNKGKKRTEERGYLPTSSQIDNTPNNVTQRLRTAKYDILELEMRIPDRILSCIVLHSLPDLSKQSHSFCSHQLYNRGLIFLYLDSAKYNHSFSSCYQLSNTANKEIFHLQAFNT